MLMTSLPSCSPAIWGRVPDYKTARIHEGEPLFATHSLILPNKYFVRPRNQTSFLGHPTPLWIPAVGRGEGAGIHEVALQPEVAVVGKI